MPSKIRYEPNGFVVLNNCEWDWESLKQVCHSDFVYEAKNRGVICNKYKLPKEILNQWIEQENWEYDKKAFWQRPYSYRIDDALTHLIQNVAKLVEIQKEVDDINFEKENLLSRVSINIEVKKADKFVKYKTFIIEKYSIKIEDDIDEFSNEKIEHEDEIRYKTIEKPEEIMIKHINSLKRKPFDNFKNN